MERFVKIAINASARGGGGSVNPGRARGGGRGRQGAGSVSISCGAAVPPTAATADAVYGPVRVAASVAPTTILTLI